METTLDKRIERPGVQRGLSSEMTGVDGRSEGGLRPFPGYRKVHEMDQLKLQAGYSSASTVVDVKAVDFRIGAEAYGYGFVYRAKSNFLAATGDVFIDWWNSATQVWEKCRLVMQGVSLTAQFDVEVMGRFVYVFVEGRSPAIFYVEATRTKEYEAEADTFLSAAATTTNYGSAATLEVATGTSVRNTLLRFDTSAEAGQAIESARVEITVSGNTSTPAVPLTLNAVTDPGASGQLWEEATATWLLRKTAVNWSTAGGTWDTATTSTVTVNGGFVGRVRFEDAALKTIVGNCLLSTYQTSAKVDLALRGTTAGTGLVSVAARTQASEFIRPKLVVTYANKTFLTPRVIGLTSGGALPGPGLQPSLKSPERGIAPGSFTSVDGTRPAVAQVVLLSDNPYTAEQLFPDQVSGLCASDTFPSPPAVTQPGSPYTHTPTGSGCTDVTGVTTQLLSPANKQTGVSVTPKLDWTTYYPSGAAVNANVSWLVFMVEEGKGVLDNHQLATLPAGLSVTSFEPASLFPQGRLAYGKKYLWKVAARRVDCTGFYEESSGGSFTTENRFQARKFEPGDYSFGYVLVDSRTGRRSAFSEVAQVRSEDFTVVRTENGNNISVKQDQYIGVEIVYDSAKYDLMYVYRSVKVQDAGGTMMAGIPLLDAVVTLEDYWTCRNGSSRTFDPAVTTNRHAMYFYELEDKQLVYQQAYVDRSVFDEKMPFAGAAAFCQNTLVVSKVRVPPPSTGDQASTADVVRGLGEMRWSSLVEMSPELFPPFNRYNPTIPSNEVVAFSKAGSNLVGLSSDRAYLVRRSGPYLRVTEMHEGYGVVNHRAVDSVGSAAYFVTTHGLSSVDGQGQLDEIRNLNLVVVREWAADLASVQIAHDPFMNALFVHNPVQQESYVLWFGTGKTTKVADASFDLATQGPWPLNWTGSGSAANPLTRRAFFLMNNPDTRMAGVGSGASFSPALYVVDEARSRTIAGATTSWNGARRITTLDFAGDSRFVASANWDSVNLLVPISAGTGTVVGTDAWKGAWVYLVDSQHNKQHIGKKFRVLYNSATQVVCSPPLVGGPTAWVADVRQGDVFVVSPVVFEWGGHPVGLVDQQGMQFSNADFFRMKIVSSVGCAFSDVAGPPLNDAVTANAPLARFRGLVWRGTQETPYAVGDTLDTEGAQYESVQDHEGVVYAAFGSDDSEGRYGVKGTSLTPGVRILCPDLEFRLLGCIVKGTITGVERTTNPRGS
jgi:hypothetical protein